MSRRAEIQAQLEALNAEIATLPDDETAPEEVAAGEAVEAAADAVESAARAVVVASEVVEDAADTHPVPVSDGTAELALEIAVEAADAAEDARTVADVSLAVAVEAVEEVEEAADEVAVETHDTSDTHDTEAEEIAPQSSHWASRPLFSKGAK